MVVHIAAATSAATQGAATALGLGMGKTDLDLARDVFRQQMQQTKRLWTAEYAEASIRHGEQCAQAARHHAEAQATATAAYFQAERLASQGIKLARDQDSRAYEMAWRAEVRESLRDELSNQNNRFNIIMLCNTVCLGCVFSLAADGSPPVETPTMMLNGYIFCLGVSIMLFTISLWGSVIVVRRLHDNTAARLEQKLFIQSEDLQRVWQDQLSQNKPTGPQEIYLVNQAYVKWVATNVDPIGMAAVNMLSVGVVMMFVTAGLLVHNRYMIEYENASISLPIIFWSIVVITSISVLYIKFSEDRKEKKKQGVYDSSWQDNCMESIGPFAKVQKAGEDLSSKTASELGSITRIESLASREQTERSFCAPTQSLVSQVDALGAESNSRAEMRKEVLRLLTTATEEYDTLPEELISRLNKVVHTIDEADERNAQLIAINGANELTNLDRTSMKYVSTEPHQLLTATTVGSRKEQPMAAYPIDAQKLPISLGSVRAELGKIPITTLLRLKNTSTEPLRLKSGLKLKEGKYVESITTSDPHNNSVCYHLYPPSEIPPRTEIVIACRSAGGWIPISGIQGEIVYTNRDESWTFNIQFSNHRVGHERKLKAEANHDGKGLIHTEMKEFWMISKEELDHKANSEIVVTVSCLHGQEAHEVALRRHQSEVILKTGYLQLRNKVVLKNQWNNRWFELTPNALVHSHDKTSKQKNRLPLVDIRSVQPDLSDATLFVISMNDGHLHQMRASSSEECNNWIQIISKTANLTDAAKDTSRQANDTPITGCSIDDSVECVFDCTDMSLP